MPLSRGSAGTQAPPNKTCLLNRTPSKCKPGRQNGADGDKSRQDTKARGAGDTPLFGQTRNLDQALVQRLGHLVPAKQLPDAAPAGVPHGGELVVGQREAARHDVGPGRRVGRVAQPACFPVGNGLDGPARVGGQHGDAREHGLEGHDAKVLVCRGVHEQAGGAEERRLERAGDAEEEEHLGVWGRGGRAELRGREGVVREREGRRERLELGVVEDVFGDAGVVAAFFFFFARLAFRLWRGGG